jgi:hypothetical protein
VTHCYTQKTEHTHNSFQKVLHYIVTLIFSLPSAPPSSLCFFLFLSKTTIITHNQPTHCATIFHLLTSLPHFSFQTQTHRKKTKRIRRVHWTRQKKSTREEEEVEELHRLVIIFSTIIFIILYFKYLIFLFIVQTKYRKWLSNLNQILMTIWGFFFFNLFSKSLSLL